ncbi:MAG TPA: FtsW/RodA/SpoVE family cell cycle protein, partial [Candidatus Polarisedimenticolia bacterium]|nr:FtsW/RodA/SpoVE family cell cycle protein [Candidatus Polarisedimenticolia bacterium]
MQARRHLGNFDWILFLSILAVSVAGLGVIFSATVGTPVAGAFHRQLAWLVIGLGLLGLAVAIDYHTLAEFSYVFYGVALALLALTLLVGRVVNASRSWLGVGGVQFQPSELAKAATVLMLAAFLGRDRAQGPRWTRFAAIAAIVGAPVLLIMLQPDLGTAVTFAPLMAGAIFLAGIRVRTLIILGLVAMLALPLVWG